MKDVLKQSAIVAALAAPLFVPLSAGAVSNPPAPLRVVSCQVNYVSQSTAVGSSSMMTNGVTVTVKNVSSKPITAFSGGGIYNKTTVLDSITHTVAPGATYTFNKRYTPFVYTNSSAQCFVSKVTFGDGTTWAAPPM